MKRLAFGATLGERLAEPKGQLAMCWSVHGRSGDFCTVSYPPTDPVAPKADGRTHRAAAGVVTAGPVSPRSRPSVARGNNLILVKMSAYSGVR